MNFSGCFFLDVLFGLTVCGGLFCELFGFHHFLVRFLYFLLGRKKKAEEAGDQNFIENAHDVLF